MKKVFLVRHAKSSWENSLLSDFERPLNKRGEKDAHFMGELLAKKKIHPNIIISSPALRAITTAKIIADKLNYPENKIHIDKNIYEGTWKELLNIINSSPESYSDLMLVGHNPALTLLNNYLSDEPIINIPTCGISGIKFEIKNWEEVTKAEGKNFLFEYPKKYSAR
ncbi:histidine phosphatase family protein [Melioribacteraceae bacterium 4301-Me]|uniref:SixA phosphatase family protein n=1 Tax=Pyranulibacter aquaticus TaxID=3163344 RepID=UPI0035957CF3